MIHVSYYRISLSNSERWEIMAVHIKSLNIDTYRGIKNLEINEMADINIITGDNNTGKTSVLEVLRILEAPTEIKTLVDIGRAMTILNERKLHDFYAVDYLFDINSIHKKISFTVKKHDDISHSIIIDAKFIDKKITDYERYEITKQRFIAPVDIPLEPKDVKMMDINFIKDGEIINKRSLYDFETVKENIKRIESLVEFVFYISPFSHVVGDIYLKDMFDNSDLYIEMLDVLKEFDENILSINSDSLQQSSRKIYMILSKNHKKHYLWMYMVTA